MELSFKALAGSALAASVAGWFAVAGAAQAPPPPAPSLNGYVGEAACLTCHEGQTRGYYRSAHGRKSNTNTPIAGKGCESCHGAGGAHAESGGDKSKIKTFTPKTAASAVDAQCLQCHSSKERALWDGSAHDSVNLSCITCHSVHQPKSAEGLLKGTRQIETCEQCHRREVQKLRRSSHMPVDEGALECSSCHNPHGSRADKLLKTGTTVNDTCEACHADKRGPFLWEHAPAVESCATCHDPHGSTNDRMLVAKEPFLCQRCHVTSQHPVTPYDTYALSNSTTANRMSGRSCAACHQNVHGSNAPSGKAFLR